MGARLGQFRHLASSIGGALLSVSVVTCNAISGAGDLGIVAGGEDAAEAASSEPIDAGVDETIVVPVEPPKACPSAGRQCVPFAPETWDGPLLVYDGEAAGIPTCPTSMALTRVEANGGTPTGSHTCGACSCGPATGVACSATVTQFNSSSCTDVLGSTTAIGSTCFATLNNVDSVRVDVASNGGSCAVQGGTPKLAPVTWPSAIKACGAPSLLADGCAAGELCVPEALAPFKARHCISKQGDETCPSGWDERLIAYRGIDDQRTCSGCGCGAPASQCTGSLRYYAQDSTCTSGLGELSTVPLSCKVVGNISGLRVPTLTGSGTCAATGVAKPSGGVTGKDPTTICCRPQ